MLVRGGVIFGGAQIGVRFYSSWIVQAFYEVPRTAFFLISGYYLINQQVKLSHTVRLWAMVLFLFFLQVRVKQPAAKRLIYVVAPMVLASYLITEQHNTIDYCAHIVALRPEVPVPKLVL